jgi:putative phosphoribosyl transferase
MRRVFEDRADAGRALAKALGAKRGAADTVVLALPRGGVPVAFEVAKELELPLDVLVVRKLGLPWQPELAMGAIASGGALVLNEDVLRLARPGDESVNEVRRQEQAELERREKQYRGSRPPLEMHGRTGIVVDDGRNDGGRRARPAGARSEARGRGGAGRVSRGARPHRRGGRRGRLPRDAHALQCRRPVVPPFRPDIR